MPFLFLETFAQRCRPLIWPFHWLLACILLVGILPLPAKSTESQLHFVPYAFETLSHGTIDAEIAFLNVPHKRSEPNGPRMKLRIVRLPAIGGDGNSPPVVYLAGGPGGSGVGTARGPRWPVFEQIRHQTDVILLDQRGTGLSEPPEDCPYRHKFDDGTPIEPEIALSELRQTAARCVAYWREEGIDLAAYTTAESAADLEDLRLALNVPKISLWGMSYGTHLALTALRLYEDSIERVVLMGVEGPDHTLKLPLSADSLLAELAIIAREQGFEDLTGMTQRLLAKLRQGPVNGRSFIHRGREVTFGIYDTQLAIATALGRRTTQQILPLVLRDAEAGDYDMLASLIIEIREQLSEFRAMPLAMEFASGASSERRAIVKRQAAESLFGDALNFPFPSVGEGLGLKVLDDAFRTPFNSHVPALFVSGTLDGRTPPENALMLIPDFKNAVHMLVLGASHDDELWLGNPIIARQIVDFISGHEVTDVKVKIDAPNIVQGKLELLMQMFGISWVIVLAITAVLSTLVAIVWLALRRRHIGVAHYKQ